MAPRRGDSFLSTLDEHRFVCHNDSSSPTRVPHNTEHHETSPDVTLSRQRTVIDWHPLPRLYGSDHYPILYTVAFGDDPSRWVAPESHTRFSYSLAKADWDAYAEAVRQSLRPTMAPVNPTWAVA